MNKKLIIGLMIIMALVLAGCDTGDSATDATAAQNLQPNFTDNYTSYEGGNMLDTMSDAAGAAALASGNVPLAAAIERAGTIIGCLEDRGAVSARGYLETSPSGIVPQGGVSLVINDDRVATNLLGCAAEGPSVGAQSLVEVCTDTGTFTFSGENFTYLYFGSGENFCAAIQQHFGNLTSS